MSCFRVTLLLFVLPLLLLLFAPGIPPYDTAFEEESVVEVPLTGNLAPNRRLDAAEDMTGEVDGAAFGKMLGPESFAGKDGFLYTGLASGDVVRINVKDLAAKWETVIHMGFPCSEIREQAICGRPLAMQFDRHGYLLVIDAYYGIFRVDVERGTKEAVGLPDEADDNVTFFNSMAANIGGDIFYTISSTRYSLPESMLEVLSISSPSGRVMKYDVKTRKNEVLLDGVCFANGVALSPREDFILVNDICRRKIVKIWVRGEKKGTSELFANTPGCPDNITPNGEGGYLVGVVTPLLPGRFSGVDLLLKYKLVRKAMARVLYNLKSLFDFLNELLPNPFFSSASFWVANTEWGAALGVPYGLVVEYDRDGNVVQSWHSPEGKNRFICEAYLYKGYLYLGSPYNEGVKRLKYEKKQ